jgi:hypothetical protein
MGFRPIICPAHQLMRQDAVLKRLVFTRRTVEYLRAGEFG